MFRAFQNSLFSIFYPQECLVCQRLVDDTDGGKACSECWRATRFFNGSEMLCDKCGALLGEAAAPVAVLCHKCDEQYFDKATAIGVYEKALVAAVINLKTAPVLPRILKIKITAALERMDYQNTDILIPIPLSKLRKLERGFNQAEVIAAEIGRSTGIPADVSSLARGLHTPIHRTGMDKKARELTVRNAFEVVRPKLINGKNILLVDDVFTSGSTASHCARILKKSGSGRVDIFTLARAVMH